MDKRWKFYQTSGCTLAMLRHGWRQFRPFKRIGSGRSDGLVGRTRRELAQVLQGRKGRTVSHELLQRAIERQVHRLQSDQHNAAIHFSLIILRSPSAAQAQQQMDEHPHEYHNKSARLFELIDFNDTFVATVLALSLEERRGFAVLAKNEIDQFCHEIGTMSFTEEQFEAITRGLSREVAVYLGAIQEGYRAVMTARAQDAMGIDIVITEPVSGKSLNIDCKTSSAFRYRIEDLVKQGKLNEFEAELADQNGFAHEINGHGAQAVAVTLLRIDQNEVGDITDFTLDNPKLLGVRLHKLFL